MITDYGVPAACGILWSLPGFYESMPVMEGAKELVREFAEVCEIHCVTATPAFAKKVRKDWLLQQFPEIEESRIHFVDARKLVFHSHRKKYMCFGGSTIKT